MAAGFVHGVLNTDNINITGESFDYGPWRFLPVFDQQFTAAYFDHSGLYAYGRQPETLLWYLVRLAECLLPIAPKEALERAVSGFVPAFKAALPQEVVRRLGLAPRAKEDDAALAAQVWAFLQESQAPFEQAFFDLFGGVARERRWAHSPSHALYAGEAFATLHDMLRAYAPAAAARLDHPYFDRASPCTMLIEEVENIWAPIASADDWSAFHQKLRSIADMAEAYGVAR
jgi:uncharacterized protein YdiU (UPF0061 family)